MDDAGDMILAGAVSPVMSTEASVAAMRLICFMTEIMGGLT